MLNPPALAGIRVLELAGLAPGPFAGLLLADNGASVLRIDRPIPTKTHAGSSTLPPPTNDPLVRHKTSIAIDLKSASGVSLLKTLAKHADVLIDPFRPGVLEKLGLGPDVLQPLNPRLVIARMTGFRRDGKYKDMAGHDINYVAVSGALSLFGRAHEKPFPPANLLGDFAGGGAMLFQGIVLALLARERDGKGQVVEANMVDGSAYLATFPRLLRQSPLWNRARGENMLDGGCPWYDTYETRDGKYMAVGALEPHFFSDFVRRIGLDEKYWLEKRNDRGTWPELKSLLEQRFNCKTRQEWEAVFDGADACCTPVLEMRELEMDASREGDQRPAVILRSTPSLALNAGNDHEVLCRQEQGTENSRRDAMALSPSQGGEEALNLWLGWRRGREFDVEDGGLVSKNLKAKM